MLGRTIALDVGERLELLLSRRLRNPLGDTLSVRD